MSNNVVSPLFQFYDTPMVQMEHMSDMSDSLTSGTRVEISRHIPHDSMLHHSVVSNENFGPVEPISNSHGFQNLLGSNNQMRPMKSQSGIEGLRESGVMVTSIGQQSLLPTKRKAEMEPAASFSVPQQLAVPNKHAVPMGSSPRLHSSLQLSTSHKKPAQMQPKVTWTASKSPPTSNKKLVRNDSSTGKSGSHQVQTPKGRTMQMDSISKTPTESNDAVRSKMRDQLAAAFSLVLRNQEETTNGEKNYVGEHGNQQISADSQHLISDSSAVGIKEKKSSDPDNLQSREFFTKGEAASSQKSFDGPSTKERMGVPKESCKELHSSFLPEEDIPFGDSFFVKDDLLQGNGLSWALEFDMGSAEVMEDRDTEKSKLVDEESGGVGTDKKMASPEKLAMEIEAELFKLFGGVNKKYKEKGRSLVFNLKDRNNPELRERVMSGEIPPDRLCTMTAEELASKELSEWRMAKAEELAQMVVLLDTDFSRRRLVKKTHKGEYQVDFEQDDGNVATDVSDGASVLSQSQPESKNVEVNPSSKVDDTNRKATIERENGKPENQDFSGSLVIPNDGTDLMQGIMVDDELKDAEFLPPIISLDEFMDSLHSEPPFQDLQVDTSRSTVSPAKETEASSRSPKSDLVGNTITKADEMAGKQTVDVAPKPSESPVAQKTLPLDAAAAALPRIEHIWAGVLQLSISSSITTFGVFKSGEKTSTADWSSSVEIKGRVRLDAFEKFIKELPLSRTRAVMVLQLVLKDNSSESERANLAEAVESYVSDERLGFAEPAAGVELYVCPPHEKMLGVLGNYVANHRDEFLNSTENGLIGIVVWRKAPISSMVSPNSSFHNKHTSKRQHLISGRPQEKDANVDMKPTTKAPPPTPAPHNRRLPITTQVPPEQSDDDDSDIPPGFGPPAARGDDDLPEFNFAGNANPSVTRSFPQTPMGSKVALRSVDKIRQLIHQYGQNDPTVVNRPLSDKRGGNVGLAIEPWNDDDDDDMPEWMPNAPMPPLPSPRSFVRPVHPSYGSQRLMPAGVQQQANARPDVSGSVPGWRHVPRPDQPPGNLGNQPPGGGLPYRMPMVQAGQRHDGSRSRGF